MNMRLTWLLALATPLLLEVPAATAAPYALEIKDTIGRSWEQEPINWQVALKPGEFKGGPVLVQREGKAIPAPADILERRPDGSAKTATVRFLIDRLEKDATTRLTADFGKAGPAAPGLKVSEEPGALVLENGLTAVRVLNRNLEQAAAGEFSPVLADVPPPR
jgi:hypothetical protein